MVNIIPKDGMNALLKLSRYYDYDNLIDLVHSLITRSWNSLHDRSDKGININAKDSIGRNALHLVFQNNNHDHMVQVAKSLIDSGVDVNATTYKTKWSPLHVLFRYYKHDNQIALTEVLIERGVDLNAKTLRGWTPLHFLCRYYNHENFLPMIGLLITNKVNLTARTEEGHSASYLLKTRYWNPPKNRDKILAILPDHDKNEPGFITHFLDGLWVFLMTP